ncbi:MAG TPA: OB-fold domain-containing protein [Mycobacteriales bacterium]|jgi:hypothetical protein|nr:OB-fold domain-containing protein [Mycobacteriales bacterium]
MTTTSTSTLGVMVRDEETAPFFDAAAGGRLAVQQCARCGSRQFPQPFTPGTDRCHSCLSPEVSWEPVSGQGTLVTWTVLRGRPAADGTPAPATVVGVVELAEGPWVHTQLRGVDETALAAGQPFTVAFEQPEGGEPLPVFYPG